MKEKRIGRYDRHGEEGLAGDGSSGKSKDVRLTGGRAVCSLLLGFAGEGCLDAWFAFPHGAKWFPALVMLWICLSVLSAVLLEEAGIFVMRADKNGCSFSKNTCILGDECRKRPTDTRYRGKVRKNVVAFSQTKSRIKAGRRLRDVC